MEQYKLVERELHGGVQKIYRFENGYGASVIRSPHLLNDLWEIAVIRFEDDYYELVYDTPVATDVIGGLSDDEVEIILSQIKALT